MRAYIPGDPAHDGIVNRDKRKSGCWAKDERNATSRYASLHRLQPDHDLISLFTLGLFLRVSRDLLAANYIANGTNYTTSTQMYAAELRNPSTGAGFYFVRHNNSRYVSCTSSDHDLISSMSSIVR